MRFDLLPLLALAAAAIATAAVPGALAATTPPTLTYEGRILDASGGAVKTSINLRFSLWKSADWVSTDSATGAINESAESYSGWQEVHAMTPSDLGVVSIKLGGASRLPTLDWDLHKYLQVEVKHLSEPALTYVLLDPTGDGGADTIDRKILSAVAYAKNAETVANRSVGTSSGDLLLLGPDGTIPTFHMGTATNSDTFTINADRSTGDTVLTFGNAILNATLRFASVEGRFDFSDDVHVGGDLSASGGFTSSGNVQFQSGAEFHSTVTLSGVTYTFPFGDGTASGKVLKTSGSGHLVWSDDRGTDTEPLNADNLDERFVNVEGDTMTGTLTIASVLRSSGAITTEAGLAINAKNAGQDAILTFGNALMAESLTFRDATNRFDFSDDVHVEGNMSASGGLIVEETVRLKRDLIVGGAMTAPTLSLSSMLNCDTLDTDSSGNVICGTDEGGSGGGISRGSDPPGECNAIRSGHLWMNTDTGLLMVCDASANRNAWLSTTDLSVIGEQSDFCGAGEDIGSEEDCAMDYGDDVGAGTRTGIGLFLPRPIMITGYGFSTDDDSACRRGGNFDIEAWGSRNSANDNIYLLETNVASNLTGEANSASNLAVPVAGDQYVLLGLNNNCRSSIDDWNLVIYYRWRHE